MGRPGCGCRVRGANVRTVTCGRVVPFMHLQVVAACWATGDVFRAYTTRFSGLRTACV